MKIAVAGVSGHTGKVVAEELLERGHAVRVIVRKPEQKMLWEEHGASVAIADLGDAETLTAALDGVDAAYLLIPPDLSVPKFAAFQKRVAESLARAVRTAGVPRVVLLSSLGAQYGEGTGPVLGVHVAETLLNAIPNTVVTAVRAGSFAENLNNLIPSIRQGVLPSFQPASFVFAMVSTRSIGGAAARLLAEPPSRSSVVQLGAFTTYAEIAATFAKQLGRDVRVLEIPLDGVKPAMLKAGMNDEVAGLFADMYGAIVGGKLAIETKHEHLKPAESIDTIVANLLRA